MGELSQSAWPRGLVQTLRPPVRWAHCRGAASTTRVL